MAFPDDPLDISVELHHSGTWNDVTLDCLSRQDIVITRGRQDETSTPDPSRCTLQINNGVSNINSVTGRYSPRNPNSDLYGLIGRNTPLRVRVGDSQSGVDLPGTSGSYASTPDTAALDITGDLDVRADITPDSWRPSTFLLVAAKYWPGTASDRSWLLHLLADGRLELSWTPDGTSAARVAIASTAAVPSGSGRLAIRATIDVDNGAAGHTVRFYTAASLAGPWTQLGADVVTAGTTSLWASAASLTVGASHTGSAAITPGETFAGLVHGLEVRDGIGGTLVADVDFDDPLATSVTDDTGLVWTVHEAYIVDSSVRFCGRVAAWPSRWDVSGSDVWVPLEANGDTRRMAQGDVPLRSAMFRTISTLPDVVAYWPLEDRERATQIASGVGDPAMVVGRLPGYPVRDVDFAAYSDFLGSDEVAEFSVTSGVGQVPLTTSTGQLEIAATVHVPEAGVGTGGNYALTIGTTGTSSEWSLIISDDIRPGDVAPFAMDRDGNTIVTPVYQGYGLNDKKVLLGLKLVQSGSDVDWTIFTYEEGTETADLAVGTLTGYTVGAASYVMLGKIGDLDGTAIGHVHVINDNLSTRRSQILDAFNAYVGETAADRMIRLADEEGLSFRLIGTSSDTEPLGAQGIDTLLGLLFAAAEADGGLLDERRDALGLEYRTRVDLENQTALALDYALSHIAPPFEPMPDDQATRNDVTVQRDGGSEYQAILTEGALSVQDPPDGVGHYAESVTLSLESDTQLEHQAGWRLHLGTVDEERIPDVGIDLARNPGLIDNILALRLGDRVTIANLPEWMPPGGADLLVQGYTETLNSYKHQLVLNTTPGSAWTVAVADDDSRYDTAGSEIAQAAAASDTTIYVHTWDGPVWTTDPTETPFDLQSAGEVWTATSIADALADTFTRTVSGGWGSADSGQAWNVSAGADFSTSGTTGDITLTSVSVARTALLGHTISDIDVDGTASTAVVATGDWITTGLVARYTDANNYVLAQIEFKETGNVGIGAYTIVAGSATFIGGVELGSYLAGEQFRVRLQVRGDAVKVKFWRATANEPSTWTIDGSGAGALSAGDVGVRAQLDAGNTNVNPVVSWDDIAASRLQAFTATRSANGVSKAHPVGTDVRLANPAILGL